MATTVELPPELLEEVEKAAREGGFTGPDDFVQWAVADKLKELRRDLFYAVTDRVKAGLAERGLTPEGILEDFEQFRRR